MAHEYLLCLAQKSCCAKGRLSNPSRLPSGHLALRTCGTALHSCARGCGVPWCTGLVLRAVEGTMWSPLPRSATPSLILLQALADVLEAIHHFWCCICEEKHVLLAVPKKHACCQVVQAAHCGLRHVMKAQRPTCATHAHAAARRPGARARDPARSRSASELGRASRRREYPICRTRGRPRLAKARQRFQLPYIGSVSKCHFIGP